METWGRFHQKSQTEPDSRLSQGLKSETFVSAEFLAQMDFTKGGSAETSLKLWARIHEQYLDKVTLDLSKGRFFT